MTIEHLVEGLRSRLEQEVDVAAAYLFGSQVRGTAGALSDVDVAVLLDDASNHHRRQLALLDALGAVVGSERIDVVVLNDAPVAVAYRVLREGTLLVSKDERKRIAHWVATVDRYLDMEPMRRRIEEGQRHRLKEGRFGRS